MNLRDKLLELETTGVALWRDGEKLGFRAPSGQLDDDTRNFLAGHKAAILALLDIDGQQGPPPADPNAPIPLTPLQEAYLLGRSPGLFLGGVGCHAYGELDAPAGYAATLPEAWSQLVGRHPMLRARPSREGWQKIDARSGPPLTVSLHGAASFDTALADTRNRLSHRFYTPQDERFWTLETLCSGDRLRLCLSIDFVIADFESIVTLIGDLDDLLAGRPLPPLPMLGFADYVHARKHRQLGLRWARDRAWWLQQADEISTRLWRPSTAEKQALQNAPARFRRFTRTLPSLGVSARAGTGAAALAAYAEALGRLVEEDGWLVNVTASARSDAAQDLRNCFGNFSTTALLPVARRGPDEPFEDWSRHLNNRLLDSLGHLSFGGVEMLRAVRHPETTTALAPFVFTNMLLAVDPQGALTRAHTISQTPQVLIDCQIGRSPEGLEMSWDVRNGYRSDSEIEAAFERFIAALRNHPVDRIEAPSSAEARYRAAVRELPGIETVRTERRESGAIRLATQVTMKPVPVENGPADAVLDTLGTVSFPPSEYGRILARLDELALAEIIDLMRRRQLDLSAPLEAEAIAEALRAIPTMQPLVSRWLDALVRHNLATRDEDGCLRLVAALPPAPTPADWHRLRDSAGDAEPRAVLDYFRLCALSLGEVVSGAANPARMFFPNGGLTVASALFGDSRMNRELHSAAGKLAVRLADALERPLRVLEIGSGTGATAKAVLNALGARPVSWTATDSNPAMLAHLEQSFTTDARVEIRRADMDHHPATDGLRPGSVDLVIAGDALHLASHPETTLRRLRHCIAPGGALVMIEMCAERPQTMISLETIYAEQGLGRHSPFRKARTWHQMLINAGFGVPQSALHADSGQVLLAAAACVETQTPDSAAIDALARHHLGIEPTAHAIFLAQESIQFPASKRLEPIEAKQEQYSHERLAEIIAFLPENVQTAAGPAATMLELGMDSLLAAQFTGRLLEHFSTDGVFFDDILVMLLEGATLARIERRLSAEPTALDAPVEQAQSAETNILAFGTPDSALAAILHGSGLVVSSQMQQSGSAVRLVVGTAEGVRQAAMAAMELSETGAPLHLALWLTEDADFTPPRSLFLTIDIWIFAQEENPALTEHWRAATLGKVSTHHPQALAALLQAEGLTR
jgi:ubiquinone/menaquinone biosynthesis C-methylase UbiE